MFHGYTFIVSRPKRQTAFFFILQSQFKNIFSLQPSVKLATFADGKVFYDIQKKKFQNSVHRCRNCCRRKRSKKTATFFQMLFIDI